MAQKWADQCLWQHGGRTGDANTSGFNRVGQNLAFGTWMDAIKATNLWHSEEDDYNYESATCRPGKVCGHYTQVG